jgi:hypothetical protein
MKKSAGKLPVTSSLILLFNLRARYALIAVPIRGGNLVKITTPSGEHQVYNKSINEGSTHERFFWHLVKQLHLPQQLK